MYWWSIPPCMFHIKSILASPLDAVEKALSVEGSQGGHFIALGIMITQL